MEELSKEYKMTINKDYLNRRAGVSAKAGNGISAQEAQFDAEVESLDIATAG